MMYKKDMKMNRKKNHRYEKIIEFLKENNNFSTIKDLASHLQVTTMTVYRDIKDMSDMDIIQQVYGGVILNQDYVYDPNSFSNYYSVKSSAGINYEEKQRISKRAVELIQPDDTLLIDSGSTTEHLAKLLPTDIPLTVLCHATNILNVLLQKPNCRIIMIGGYFHSSTQCFESMEGLQMIKRIRTSKAFISASGIHDKLGVTCYHMFEAETKKAIMESSIQKILLSDSTKFGKVTNSLFAAISDFDVVITDDKVPRHYVDYINQLGKTCYIE